MDQDSILLSSDGVIHHDNWWITYWSFIGKNLRHERIQKTNLKYYKIGIQIVNCFYTFCGQMRDQQLLVCVEEGYLVCRKD